MRKAGQRLSSRYRGGLQTSRGPSAEDAGIPPPALRPDGDHVHEATRQGDSAWDRRLASTVPNESGKFSFDRRDAADPHSKGRACRLQLSSLPGSSPRDDNWWADCLDTAEAKGLGVAS